MTNIHSTLDALTVPIDGLKHYGRNPRRGNQDLITDSLTHHGQYRPIVVRAGTNEVLAGNHTLAAARDLGWEKIAATFVDVDDDQAARIVLVDNRTNDVAGYDETELKDLLESLPDLEGTGYSDEDIAALINADEPSPVGAGLTDPDKAPGTAPATISALGDVWLLGGHRVVVGDSLKSGAWDALLGESLADAVWTDPPYGVAYVGKTSGAMTIDNDDLDQEQLRDFLISSLGHAVDRSTEGAAVYVATPPGPLHAVFADVLLDIGVLRQTLIWVKDQFVMGRSDYHYRHEPIYYGWKPGAAHHAPPDRTQSTVFEVPRPKRSDTHPTMKPVQLIERHLANSVRPGGLVVDPFGGSGSTLIAAHRVGCRAALIEIDPVYADVTCRRWQDYTGVIPVLERTGEPVDFRAD